MYKIMVIEDDPAIREELEVLLKTRFMSRYAPRALKILPGRFCGKRRIWCCWM